jgi:tetratricopeptide (TPR) repeat protein
MTFEEILDQAIAMLQRRGRLTYGTLKRQFQLDAAALDALKTELIKGQRLAVDEDGIVLVWTGDASSAPLKSTPPSHPADRVPLTYTPPHLTEKILAGRPALAGERKQVTVLFADLKDSTELIRGLDPEAAQQLLDPALHHMIDAVHRFEGTVNQVLGDGIMALFGAPIAHEDHALRACYAAMAMQSAMRAYTEAVRRTRGLELRMRVGLSIRIGGLLGQAYRVAWLSEVCRLAGRNEEAWQHAHQALDLARQQKERGSEALVLHQLGVVQAHADLLEAEKAEAYYHQALALADELGMRPLLAHCHRSLGTLYAATGQQEQARTALTTAIALYRAMGPSGHYACVV